MGRYKIVHGGRGYTGERKRSEMMERRHLKELEIESTLCQVLFYTYVSSLESTSRLEMRVAPMKTFQMLTYGGVASEGEVWRLLWASAMNKSSRMCNRTANQTTASLGLEAQCGGLPSSSCVGVH